MCRKQMQGSMCQRLAQCTRSRHDHWFEECISAAALFAPCWCPLSKERMACSRKHTCLKLVHLAAQWYHPRRTWCAPNERHYACACHAWLPPANPHPACVLPPPMPGAFTLGMWLLRKTRQCLLVNCMKGASQSAWNAAWVGDQFLLNAR